VAAACFTSGDGDKIARHRGARRGSTTSTIATRVKSRLSACAVLIQATALLTLTRADLSPRVAKTETDSMRFRGASTACRRRRAARAPIAIAPTIQPTRDAHRRDVSDADEIVDISPRR